MRGFTLDVVNQVISLLLKRLSWGSYYYVWLNDMKSPSNYLLSNYVSASREIMLSAFASDMSSVVVTGDDRDFII